MSGTPSPVHTGGGAAVEDLFAAFDEKRHVQELRAVAPEMFDDHDTSELEFDGLMGLAPSRRGRGRPKGSPNKLATDTARFIKARYGSPIVSATHFGIFTPETLVAKVNFLKKELQITAQQALDFIVSQQKLLAPYVEQALPVKVDLGDGGGFALVVAPRSFRLPDGDGPPAIDVERAA